MNKKNIIIYTSSRNNYDMLENEVFNIDFEGFEFINVDDKSSQSEIERGIKLCNENNITFLQNKSRGVQMATQTLIDFINENRPECKYIICFQHDVVPISNNFFKTISEYISNHKLDEFGSIGFNVLDNGDYTYNSYDVFLEGEFPVGMIGLAHLSVSSNTKRWMSPRHNIESLNLNIEKWSKPFIIEFPVWMVIGINVGMWNKYVIPTTDYHFHLWFPDIAMQFNKVNLPSLVIPTLYCLNKPEIKNKYGIHQNSAQGAKLGNDYHFGEYSNFDAWKSRWGWEYENVKATFPVDRYKGTLIGEYFEHDNNKGPLRNYEL